MYDLAVELTLSAGHQLRGYRGKCEKCHGHNWKIRLEVSAESLDAVGLVVDFGELKAILQEVTAGYDHVMLNDLPEFADQNPTSENLARVIYQRCRERIQALQRPVRIAGVVVWESEGSSVRYHE